MDEIDLSGWRGWLARGRFALTLARPRRYLFILSHMRSYSSLLCHILHTNPDVAGYVELHQPYRTGLDLWNLQIKVAHINQNRLEGRYVLDKLLHNHADVSDEVLRRDDLYTVFSIREPEQTIKSTIAMVQRKKQPEKDWKSNPTKVANYYVRRLERLTEMAAKKPERSLFMDADRLIDQSEDVLAAMTTFLGLKEPLRSEYEVFDYTGKPKFGDPGKFITSGSIVKERAEYADIEIPEEDLLKAKQAYQDARTSLAASCQIVAGSVE